MVSIGFICFLFWLIFLTLALLPALEHCSSYDNEAEDFFFLGGGYWEPLVIGGRS